MTSHDTLRNRKRIFSDDVVVLVEEEQPDGVISTNMKRDTNLNTLDAATRDWHIELLSGLFLRSTEQELNYLESEVASNERVDSPSATSVNSAPKNLYSEHTACPGGAVEHSVLPLISSALLEICPQKKADQDEFDRPLLIPESWRRPSYQSLTLLELEQKINNSKCESAGKNDWGRFSSSGDGFHQNDFARTIPKKCKKLILGECPKVAYDFNIGFFN